MGRVVALALLGVVASLSLPLAAAMPPSCSSLPESFVEGDPGSETFVRRTVEHFGGTARDLPRSAFPTARSLLAGNNHEYTAPIDDLEEAYDRQVGPPLNATYDGTDPVWARGDHLWGPGLRQAVACGVDLT